MTYDKPYIRYDVGESQPYFCDIVDKDGELVRLEWNGGDVIVSVPSFKVPTDENGLKEAIPYSCSTPNIPVEEFLKALITFQTMCVTAEFGEVFEE